MHGASNRSIARTSDSTIATYALYFLSGLGATFMAYSIYSNLKSYHERNHELSSRRKRDAMRLEAIKRIENSISLRSLAYLTQSNDINIQSGAVKIILDRAVASLPFIINACKEGQPIETRTKAISALQLLTRKEQYRGALVSAGALEVLVDTLKCTDPEMKESTLRYAAVALCDLTQMSDLSKSHLVRLGVLEPIKHILTSSTIQNNELKYWTLMLLYQILRSDPFPKEIVTDGFVGILATMARATFGNTNMPKFCIQSLVRIVSNVDPVECNNVLVELLKYDIVNLISICLRAEDLELVYWATGLMHEFVLKDVEAERFREIKGVHGILTSLLAAEEVYITRVVLRTVKFMAYGHEKFRQGMVRSAMVYKIMQSLKLEDDDVRYWAILCIHAVAAEVESHYDIIMSSEFDLFLELTVSRKAHIALFASDILSLLCCMADNSVILEKHADQLVSTLNTLVNFDEVEVQYNAAGAIFNLMAMQEEYAKKVRAQCLETFISLCVASTHERMQLTCAKALLMMAIKYRSIVTRVTLQVIEPLVNTCIETSSRVLPFIMIQSLRDAKRNRRFGSKDLQHYKNKHWMRAMSNLQMSSVSTTLEPLTALEQDSEESSSSSDGSSSGGATQLLNFELPVSSRLQFVGALSALRILLENEDVFGNMVTGTVFDNLLADINKMEEIVEGSSLETFDYICRQPSRLGEIGSTARQRSSSASTSSSSSTLPDTIRDLIDALVLHALYPVLSDWASSHVRRPGVHVEKMDERASRDAYRDFLEYIRESVETIVKGSDTTATVNVPSSSSSSSRRPMTFAPSDDSSDEFEDTNDDDDEAYIVTGRKVESAAERLGETRRKGEEHDSATVVEDMSTSGWPLQCAKLYSGFAVRALMVLRSLMRYASVRQYVIQELHFVEAMIYMFQKCRSLSDHIMTCLGTMICADPSFVMPESLLQLLSIAVWKHAQLPIMEKRSFHFYARLILAYASGCAALQSSCDNHPGFAEIDVVRRSKYCLLNYETRLDARNDSWTFETVRCTHSVPGQSDTGRWDATKTHKYAFEVVLVTNGLMQVGWVTDEFEIDPEGGTGVGDDEYSYGYDGCRVKKWHAQRLTRRRDYGLAWAVGDTITCAIDMDAGEIRYYQNGKDLGVAFTEVDTSKPWYPAASLSTGQECRFRFGGSLDRLRYLPDGYMPIACLAAKPSRSERDSFGEDIDFLASAMQRMSVRSRDGSAESVVQEPAAVSKAEATSQQLRVRLATVDDQVLVPSLYFEAMVGYCLTDDTTTDNVLRFGLRSLTEANDVVLEYRHDEKSAVFKQGQDAQMVPFDLQIKDGDVIGMAFVHEKNMMAITFNGDLYVVIELLSGAFRPYIPWCTTNTGKAKVHINHGDDLFVWQRGNAMKSKEKMANYLGQL